MIIKIISNFRQLGYLLDGVPKGWMDHGPALERLREATSPTVLYVLSLFRSASTFYFPFGIVSRLLVYYKIGTQKDLYYFSFSIQALSPESLE